MNEIAPKRGKTRKLPKVGDEITIRARVTRVGRNAVDTAATITLRIPGYDVPVTVAADRLADPE